MLENKNEKIKLKLMLKNKNEKMKLKEKLFLEKDKKLAQQNIDKSKVVNVKNDLKKNWLSLLKKKIC